MIETVHIAIVSAACSFAIAGCTVVGFWMRFSDRVTTANTLAAAAQKEAEAANALADQAHNRITALVQLFGEYREQVAKEYSSTETVRQLESKMTAAIDRLGDKLGERIDRLLEKHEQ